MHVADSHHLLACKGTCMHLPYIFPSLHCQDNVACIVQLVPCLVGNLGCLSTGLAIGYYTVFLSWATKVTLTSSPG